LSIFFTFFHVFITYFHSIFTLSINSPTPCSAPVRKADCPLVSVPGTELSLSRFAKHCVGVHIRRTDNPVSMKKYHGAVSGFDAGGIRRIEKVIAGDSKADA